MRSIILLARCTHFQDRRLTILLCCLVWGLSAAALGAQCVDSDGDGFGFPASADCSAGASADCDDGDASVFPGATELCNERDDDCDGEIDEEFFVGEICGFGDPDPLTGPCFTAGTNRCLEDGSGTFCDVAGAPLELFSAESESEANCNDLADNDCDGLADRADPDCTLPGEVYCDDTDDDQNGLIDDTPFDVGQPCTVGVGGCARSGFLVCGGDPTADSVCSATAGRPVTEGPVGHASCFDGVDNDCDGQSDLDDVGCTAVELCDGVDNDGDLAIDEDFPSLGAECISGEGICRASGFEVCAANGLGTECGAFPGPAGFEGPTGSTCRDGLDNDCDGLADGADPSCASADLRVECALPYVHGQPGGDCNGWHRIEYSISGGPSEVEVSAELLALGADGALLGRLPVEPGDLAQLASRRRLQVTSKNNRHKVFAPVPMLRVEVDSGQRVIEAFCSPLPYLDVIEPSGNVVSASGNAALEVVAAVPLVEPESLAIFVDGVDLLAELGLDPEVSFPGGPYSGSMLLGGRMIEVSELVVDIAADPSTPSANRLSLGLGNLGGGGHAIRIAGEPLATAARSAQCHRDDLDDAGIGNVFEVTLLAPQPLTSTAQVPTPVRGEITHGREIAAVSVNGKELDVSAQTLIAGDGETSGDLYTLSVDTTLDATDLALEITTGDGAPGSLDSGWNRVVLAAQDDAGNQAFANAHAAITATQAKVQTLASDGLENALIFGLTTPAGQTLFTTLCETQGQDLLDDVTDEIDQAVREVPETRIELSKLDQTELNLVCSDKNRVDFDLKGVDFESGFELAPSCEFSLLDGAVHMSADLPDATPRFEADGLCKNVAKNVCIGATINGSCVGFRTDVCLLKAETHVEGGLPLTDLGIGWTLSEEQLESGGTVPVDFFFPDSSLNADITDSEVDLGCIAGFFFDVAEWTERIVWVFDVAFGGDGVDFIPSLEDTLEDELEGVDVSDFFDVPDQGPALPIPEIGLSSEFPSFGLGFDSKLDQVEIEADPGGQLQASFRAEFFPTRLDPEVMPLLPPPQTAPAPADYPADAGNLYLAVSDDLFNSLFSSMTLAGSFSVDCQPSGTVGDYLLPGQPPPFGLSSDTPLLACTRLDVPPRLLLHADEDPAAVEASLRLNDLSMALVADRNENGVRDSHAEATPDCGDDPADADCLFAELCLDLNVETELETFVDAAGDPGLLVDFTDVRQRNQRQFVVCGGPHSADQNSLSNALIRAQVQTLLDGVVQNTPPLRIDGLSLGASVQLDAPRLIVIETDGDPEFQDYLAITGDLVQRP